jgi:hypothetical protein
MGIEITGIGGLVLNLWSFVSIIRSTFSTRNKWSGVFSYLFSRLLASSPGFSHVHDRPVHGRDRGFRQCCHAKRQASHRATSITFQFDIINRAHRMTRQLSRSLLGSTGLDIGSGAIPICRSKHVPVVNYRHRAKAALCVKRIKWNAMRRGLTQQKSEFDRLFFGRYGKIQP